jgi:hypothetical protein
MNSKCVIKNVVCGILSFGAAVRLQAGIISDTAATADAIVVGNVATRFEGPDNVSFDINVERVLKGDSSLRTIHISYQWTGIGNAISSNQKRQIDARIRGIWCLQHTPSGWDVLAVRNSPFGIGRLLWPVADALPPDYQYSPSAPLLDILTYEIAAGHETGGHPEEMIGATGTSNTPALQTVFAHLLTSQKPALRAVAIAGMLSGGQQDSIAKLGQYWPTISADRNASLVLRALRYAFRDTTPGSILQLAQLADAQSTSVELRQAAIWAVSSIHTRESMPFLAGLLLSSDPDERARAVFGMSSFANGCPPQTLDNVKSMEYLQFKNPSLYRNVETIAHFTLGSSTNISAGDQTLVRFVAFWQDWWDHHPELH